MFLVRIKIVEPLAQLTNLQLFVVKQFQLRLCKPKTMYGGGVWLKSFVLSFPKLDTKSLNTL